MNSNDSGSWWRPAVLFVCLTLLVVARASHGAGADGGGGAAGGTCCQDGDTPEGEPCGDDTNSCDHVGSIVLGETICGTTWGVLTARDLDWFQFTLSEPATVSFLLEAEPFTYCFLYTGTDMCFPVDVAFAFSADCAPGAASAALAPGTYALNVFTLFGGAPCGTSNDYRVTLSGPSPACGRGGGDCCQPHAGPGCDNLGCCATVCALDPACCDIAWDSPCAAAAADLCAVCNAACHPGAGDCCEWQSTPGCGDPDCCEFVCRFNPYCCEVVWDVFCAKDAANVCAVCDYACNPRAGDCCRSQPTPGCNDPTCCGIICGFDPFCCETQWDAICVSEAEDLCGDLCNVLPANDLCANATPILPGHFVFGSTVGATLDDVPACGPAIEAPGVWYAVEGTGQVLTASTCNQGFFDTRISVWCGSCDALVCVTGADDTPGCGIFTTMVSWCSQPGASYLILVHGGVQFDEVGPFELDLLASGDSCISCTATDVTADGFTDVDDLTAVISAWGCPAGGPPCPDANGDGVTDVSDLIAVILNWNCQVCPSPG